MDFNSTQLLNFTLESNIKSSNSSLNTNLSVDFGFTIAGYCPSYILNVEETSYAYKIGLRNGDSIVKIDNINCCRATIKTIVKLINKQKQSGLKLNITIHRTAKLSTRYELLLLKQNKKLAQKRRLKSILFCAPLNNLIKKAAKPVMSKEDQVSQTRLTREDSIESKTDYYSIQGADTGYETQSQDDDNDATLISVSDQKLPFINKLNEERRTNLIAKLIDLEINFVNYLNNGVSTFSRPLRGFFLRQQDYFALFQNIEKILVITENFLQSMEKWSPYELYYHIGQFYNNKIKLLNDALRFYVNGYSNSKLLLNDLKLNSKKFRCFLNETETNNFNLNNFLDLPIAHFNQLFELLIQISSLTSKDSQEYLNLQQTIDYLKDIFDDVELINEDSLLTSMQTTKYSDYDDLSSTNTNSTISEYSTYTYDYTTNTSNSTIDSLSTIQETTIYL